MTRLSMDSDLCIGSGLCNATAPGVFDQDDEGYSSVRPGKEDGSDPLTPQAVRGCPVQAIVLTED